MRRGLSLRGDCRFALASFDRYDDPMRWPAPSPVRSPPGFIEPCLATNRGAVPSGPQSAYEIKRDGFRFICRRELDRVCVFSRPGHDWTDRVPRIADALTGLHVTSLTIDGEGVVCGPDGVTDFDLLRAAVGRKGSRDAFLYACELLELDGRDLRQEAWEARRDALASLLRAAEHDTDVSLGIRMSEHFDGADGEIMFQHACRMGLEGIRPAGDGQARGDRDRDHQSGHAISLAHEDAVRLRRDPRPVRLGLPHALRRPACGDGSYAHAIFEHELKAGAGTVVNGRPCRISAAITPIPIRPTPRTCSTS